MTIGSVIFAETKDFETAYKMANEQKSVVEVKSNGTTFFTFSDGSKLRFDDSDTCYGWTLL